MSSVPPEDPHVLFLCSSLEVGGGERQLSFLVPALRRRRLLPDVVALRARGRFYDELSAQGISTRFLEVRSRFDLLGVRRTVSAVGIWPDIVVSQGLDAQIVGCLVARHAGTDHVTIHHKQPELRLTAHRRLLTRLVARHIDRVVAVNSTQIPDLLAHGFRRDRIEVIANGVPEPAPTKAVSDVRSELGLTESDFVALLVATLRPEKRAPVFVDAVVAANSRVQRIRGLVAGQGPELETVRARASGSEAVTVLGERSDIADLMAASDVVCLTSAAEALPMVILEAMALGKPVIATDVGGVSQAVTDGETGILTPVDQGERLLLALCDLADDPTTASALGKAARSRYDQHYSLELMADNYAALLTGLLARPSRRSSARS